MSSNKKNLLKTLLTGNAGSCGCGRPKLSDVYEPKPKSKISATTTTTTTTQNPKLSDQNINNNIISLSAAMENDDLTSTSLSYNIDTTITSSSTLNSESEPDLPRVLPSNSKVMMLSPCPKITDSIAVVKVSNDPYHDFRHSMLQMILEKQIFSKTDLQELLQCFLELNAPCQHDVIVKAFMEIWNQVMVTAQQQQQQQQEEEEEPCNFVVHGEKERNMDPS
ncbi:hypothetical protein CCACVL1_05009 [Corchorus capsularis]|uniref:Transcription repressor n=1 Tax=Corchorus capsularis TaxID=210143 RepID=A0A1R3JNI4_COCAP|nr:hypothetical protein CCACVL1_05009 [Corchorus capsularis]